MHLPGMRKLLSAAVIAALSLSTGLVSGTPAFAARTHATKVSTKAHKHAKKTKKHAKARTHAKASKTAKARKSVAGKKVASHKSAKTHKHVRHA
jgi:type III secretory pathway component EscV